MARDSLLEFPCDFPIKVMGRSVDGLAERIAKVVGDHTETQVDIDERPSRRGNYLAFGVTIRAESQQQIDDLYRALVALDEVLVVL